MSTIQVFYEDNHIIAVYKPAGVLSQGDKTGDVSLFDEVKLYLMKKKNKKTPSNPSGQAGNVFLGLLHRLDRPVCGIMIFAKTSKGASRLSEQFRNHAVEKTYQAVVIGSPPQSKGILTNLLGKDIKTMKAREFKDGEVAKLYYEVLQSNGKYSLLKIKIDTGKFHQIRAQLSVAGLPILGDVKYGGEKWEDKNSIALCATGISFKAATEDKIVNLSMEIPKEWEQYLK